MVFARPTTSDSDSHWALLDLEAGSTNRCINRVRQYLRGNRLVLLINLTRTL